MTIPLSVGILMWLLGLIIGLRWGYGKGSREALEFVSERLDQMCIHHQQKMQDIMKGGK